VIKRILVPTYDSKCSEKGSRHAIEIAERCGAKVTFAHILHSKNGSARMRLRDIGKDAIKEAEGFLEDAAAKAKAKGIKTETKILLSKSIPAAILKEAKSRNYDLILMCSRDMTATKRLLSMSVCEQVIKKAPCPVFVYR